MTATIAGTGIAGVAEGKDTQIVTVTKIPPIEVYAGPDATAKEGEPVTFSGSFTRPEGPTDFKFSWDFGDGSEPVKGSLPGAATAISATHTFPNHRPLPFKATLTVIAQSAAGEIKGADDAQGTIAKSTPWVSRWDPTDTLKRAVRAISATGRVLGDIGIWLGIFSPLWAIGLVTTYIIYRRNRARP